MGPLKILQKIGDVYYKMELPPSMKRAHNIFHVSRLKPYGNWDIRKGVDVVINADGEIEQEIESIFKHKGTKRKRQYFVKFVGQEEVDAI